MEMDQDQCSEISSTSGIEGEVIIPRPKKKMDQRNGEALQPSSSSRRTSIPPPALLEMKHKKFLYCGITDCAAKVERLTFASSHVLAYYGIKNKLAMVKVCDDCLKKANDYQEGCVEAIRNRKCIFKCKHEPHIAQTIDLVDDNDETPNSSRRVPETDDMVKTEFDRGDVEGLVHDALKKFKIQAQLNSCRAVVARDAERLGDDFGKLEHMMTTISNVLFIASKQYNNAFAVLPKKIVGEEVEIRADGATRTRKLAHISSTAFLIGQSGSNATGAEENGVTDTNGLNPSTQDTSNVTEIKRKPGPASKTNYYDFQEAEAAKKGPFHPRPKRPEKLRKTMELKETPKFIPKPKPNMGDIVYVMYKSVLNFWLQAEVELEIFNDDTEQMELVVHLEPLSPKGMPTGGAEDAESIRRRLQVSLKEIAYNVPFPFKLPVGTRIIAKFTDEDHMDPEAHGHYYAGIVADQPKEANSHRYLIFFDDGYAQYVYPEEVLLICHSSQEVWNDVHPDMRDFVFEYIKRYPEWPLAKLTEGSITPVEWNGKWLPARVIEVDGHLVKMRFENDGREEWIYRGSSRLKPVFEEFENEDVKQEVKEEEPAEPKHDSNVIKDEVPGPSRENKNEPKPTTSRPHKIARKSTSRFQYPSFFRDKNSTALSPMLDVDVGIEFKGTMKKIRIPDDAPKPKKFVPHQCDSSCVIEFVPTKEMRTRSPIAIPMFLGWEREVAEYPSRAVFYRTPCGLRLRNYEELKKFLEVTDSNLFVDHFTFERAVQCMEEFVPDRALFDLKDISYGKESVPITCINSVDYESLPYMEYTPVRIQGKGVNLNTDDEGFMVCCDCTDNCEDKSKCACWQLTMEGKITNRDHTGNVTPITGYKNGRLLQDIPSGIYECNSRCKCKQTCSNRVVQKGVRWPFQIFKTTRKGWGIRALFDMPAGSFICVYTGEVLPDEVATKEGTYFGDEYLADLDFIDCLEKQKEGYESDVTDIEAEEEQSSQDDSDFSSDSDEENVAKKSRVEGKDCHADGDDDDDCMVKVASAPRNVAKRRTDGRKFPVPDEDGLLSDEARIPFRGKISLKRKKRKRLREYFGDSQYTMDAKKTGNFGRYLNHSCVPNVFVQNVFVDTHDPRFPLVAFFTNRFVRAGTELTWDYNYAIGSVPGKTLYCYCMTSHCRGRLL